MKNLPKQSTPQSNTASYRPPQMVELDHPTVSEPILPIENKLASLLNSNNNNNNNNMSNTTDNNNDPPPSPSPPPMNGDDGGDNNGGGEGDQESNKRSERKRRREKQRRSDLSNAFDELAAFIVQVEPSNTDDGGTDKKGKKRKSSDGGEDSSGITRLDLIGRALRIMKRLYRENEERKRVIVNIEGRGGVGGGNNDNVSVN